VADLELRVDRIRCDGAGLCAELLPEMISLDDWGYPILRAGTIPDQLLVHARAAADACPLLALRLAPVRVRAGRTPAIAPALSVRSRRPALVAYDAPARHPST
jgi:ferredoxin